MLENKKWLFILCSFLALIGLWVKVSAQDNAKCTGSFILFAKGSGQEDEVNTDEQPQTVAFFDSISKTLNDGGITTHVKSLDYDANGDLTDFLEAFFRIDALGEYSESYGQGVGNAVEKINQRAEDCEDQPIVLGGFSQGAHVMGNTLERLDQKAKDNIAYVGLFGNPRFNNTSFAARGTFDSWHGGIFGSRNEFPTEFEHRVYSFCKDGDGICEGNLSTAFGEDSKHSTYQNHEIPMAAKEAAEQVKFAINKDDPNWVNPKLDVVFVYDNSWNHRAGYSTQLKLGGIKSMAQAVEESRQDVRVGLTAYTEYDIRFNDRGKLEEFDNSHNTLQLGDYTTPSAAYEAFYSQRPQGTTGNDKQAVHAGLTHAIQYQDWRPTAQKAIILLTNTRPKGQEDGRRKTQGHVLAALRRVNTPISIHSITKVVHGEKYFRVGYHRPYAELAFNTGGSVYFPDGTEGGKYYTGLAKRIINRLDDVPLQLGQLNNYPSLDVGETVYFGVPEKYDNEKLRHWKFDFNGDGNFEEKERRRHYKGYTQNYHLQSDMQVKIFYRDPGTLYGEKIVKPEVGTYEQVRGRVPFSTEPPLLDQLKSQYSIRSIGQSQNNISGFKTFAASVLAQNNSGATFDVKLSWQPPDGNGGSPIQGYRVYNCKDQLISLRPPDEPYLTITGISPDQLECVKITSLNKYGESDPIIRPIKTPEELQSDQSNHTNSDQSEPDSENPKQPQNQENTKESQPEYTSPPNADTSENSDNGFFNRVKEKLFGQGESKTDAGNQGADPLQSTASACVSLWCRAQSYPVQTGLLALTATAVPLGGYIWRRKII